MVSTTTAGDVVADGGASVVLAGRITAYTAAPIWKSALDTLDRNPSRPVIVDASRLEYADNVGIALVFDLLRRERPAGAKVEIRALAPNLAALVRGYAPSDFAAPPRVRLEPRIVEQVGRAAAQQVAYLKMLAGFLVACGNALRRALTRRGVVSWPEVFDVATEAGANAVPIVTLVAFLMGVIIAFEIGLVARRFGAALFVVDGVGIAMLRELGALMTAIVFAGRTGAAFAAQIGTQKVNEEVNALSTFGLDPIAFLVVPRLIAAALVVPLLAVLADIVGIFGGGLVMTTFDIGFLQSYTELLGAVSARDFVLGIAKAAVFGVTIAAVGCQRGLAAGAGATSVGLAATSTVVTSIVLVVVIDQDVARHGPVQPDDVLHQALRMGYGTRVLLDDASFDVARGEVLVILGGSGCGKSHDAEPALQPLLFVAASGHDACSVVPERGAVRLPQRAGERALSA